LFFWNSRPDDGIKIESDSPWRFNPCFSGTRARTTSSHSGRWNIGSFNPCFSGTRARTWRFPLHPQVLPKCFNPCFSGTRARTFISSHPRRGMPSFNPCFSGTRARTQEVHVIDFWTVPVSILVFLELAPGLLTAEGPNDFEEFQSLFFWNSRPDPNCRQQPIQSSQFQSLFFWNSRPDAITSTSGISLWWFQSLFFWVVTVYPVDVI